MPDFTLKYATMCGYDGDLNEGTEETSVSGADVKEAAVNSNTILKEKTCNAAIPFMPRLLDSAGQTVAATVAAGADENGLYAHRLIWIRGSAVGSSDEWVRV